MGFQSVQIAYHSKVPPGIAPYYGLSALAKINQETILAFTGRGKPSTLATTFSLDAPSDSGLYMYFAYPASYGYAKFLDEDSMFYGGWDGANDDPQNVFGPLALDVVVKGKIVPFYVYRTDYPELAVCHWVVSAA